MPDIPNLTEKTYTPGEAALFEERLPSTP